MAIDRVRAAVVVKSAVDKTHTPYSACAQQEVRLLQRWSMACSTEELDTDRFGRRSTLLGISKRYSSFEPDLLYIIGTKSNHSSPETPYQSDYGV